ncbi:phage tail family protein [Streptomyces sp. PCS3-D2]|uniref:phage tail domain-containing protein n=1 Tax=Streptomyces sp. PCS3-D2 TaxID=1460244 RepID=UPI00044827CD|nr:phage tail domain-containing protein [Streptomyces sp. PCS3-D2]WKV74150.1 phage tail family protein [Streptomyces sp. PCS3-D2]
MSTALKDFQIEIGGVVLGHGTSIPIAEVEGLGRAPVRGELVPRPGADGAWAGSDWYDARTVRIDCAIKTPGDPAAARQILADLQEAADAASVRTAPGANMPLRIKWPGSPTRVLFGRLRRLEPSWEQAAFGWVPLDVEFAATDPYFHGDTVSALTLSLSSRGLGGLKAPVKAPVNTGTSVPQERRGMVRNDGDMPAWPTIRITGPVISPRIYMPKTGALLELGVSLATGERIDIETRPGTRWALRNGSENVASSLSGDSRLDGFQIPTGSTELWWTARGYSSASRLAVTWRSAHIAL